MLKTPDLKAPIASTHISNFLYIIPIPHPAIDIGKLPVVRLVPPATDFGAYGGAGELGVAIPVAPADGDEGPEQALEEGHEYLFSSHDQRSPAELEHMPRSIGKV